MVDETFLEQMMLVLMDLRTGYLLLEEVAEDRTYATWKAGVEARLTALGTGVRYLVSDRAKALIQLAEQGLECLSMPDFFHCMHDLVKGSALSLARQVRHARQELTKAEAVLSKHTGPDGRPQGDAEAQHHVEVKRAAVQQWEECKARIATILRPSHSRCILFTFTTPAHKPPSRSTAGCMRKSPPWKR